MNDNPGPKPDSVEALRARGSWRAKKRKPERRTPSALKNWPDLPPGTDPGAALIYEALKATAAPPEKATWGERMTSRCVAFIHLVDTFYSIDATTAPELEALLADAIKRLGEKWFQLADGIDALHDEAYLLAGIESETAD